MLEINHVSKKYGAKEALRDVSLSLPRGQIVACSGRTARARPR